MSFQPSFTQSRRLFVNGLDLPALLHADCVDLRDPMLERNDLNLIP
jgi:hypothetical protein